jgi:biotin carboxyl carrier protein
MDFDFTKDQKYESFRVYMAEYKTLITEKFRQNAHWRPPNENHVLAIIPGTILEIRVKEGQHVQAGETLLILDAMKMENHITMPFDGKVKKIRTYKGEVVTKNQVMIEIDT